MGHKKKTINADVENFLDVLLGVSRENKIYFLEGVKINFCSGWYIPKYSLIFVFKHDGHRRIISELKQIAMDKKRDCGDLWKCEWMRFNINGGNAWITAGEGKYDEVMDLLGMLKPYVGLEMGVEFKGGRMAMFKPDDIDTKDDLIKKFWVCRMKF